MVKANKLCRIGASYNERIHDDVVWMIVEFVATYASPIRLQRYVFIIRRQLFRLRL